MDHPPLTRPVDFTGCDTAATVFEKAGDEEVGVITPTSMIPAGRDVTRPHPYKIDYPTLTI
eukprot:748763-Hanusia_phi.AAC.1